MPEFRVPTNDDNKATSLRLAAVCGPVSQNPHMRAFWASTISFFLAFFGWFALAPVFLEVAHSMKMCENQMYDPLVDTTRPAFIKWVSPKDKTKAYCVHGQNKDADPPACNPVPEDIKQLPLCANGATDNCATQKQKSIYDPTALPTCLCTGGTTCRNNKQLADVLSAFATIIVRASLGFFLVKFGPVNVQTTLMFFGAFWVFLSCAITDFWNYTLIRFFIGFVGASFVTNQYWCTSMFAPEIVGTVNATAAGWGNLGGGVTQIVMVLVFFAPLESAFGNPDTAWRVSMVFPGAALLLTGICIKLLCWDTPTQRRIPVSADGSSSGPSLYDYVKCLADYRVVIMVLQYGACFGTEIHMNNLLATHFRQTFGLTVSEAGALASAFGGMNLFARSLGGMLSDALNAKFGMRGRLWAHFLALFFEGLFLLAFGFIDGSNPWYTALTVMCCFSLCVQAAEGTSYGIVPFMRSEVAIVSALVGAGGNLGAVIAGLCIYRPIGDTFVSMKVHGGYVLFWALMTPFLWWPEYGSMFTAPTKKAAKETEGTTETAM